jgi:hypothetical protein
MSDVGDDSLAKYADSRFMRMRSTLSNQPNILLLQAFPLSRTKRLINSKQRLAFVFDETMKIT